MHAAATRNRVGYDPATAFAASRTPVDRVALPNGRARVRGLRDVVGVGVLLDDRVALVALDDVLDVGDVVTGVDREPPRVAMHGLVLGARQLDELLAAEAAAFTHEGDRATGALRAHGFVDRAIRRLVHRDALLVLFVHADHLRCSSGPSFDATRNRICTVVPSTRWSISSSSQRFAMSDRPRPSPGVSVRGAIPTPSS